jgi:hypothetical protein
VSKRLPKRKSTLDDELADLAPAESDPSSPDVRERVLRALGSKHALVVARAAALIGGERLDGYDDLMIAAYARFLENPAKSDPGCRAKHALLEALDHVEHIDHEPFLNATEYVQREPRYGGAEDTATGVRARGALALARLGYPDVFLVLGRLLSDEEATVRQAAALALGYLGRRDGAGLLVLRIRAGEAEPTPLAECIRSLVLLAPDQATATVAPLLADPDLRELVAHALATADTDAGVDIVIAELERSLLEDERAPLLAALGASRRPRARELLLSLVADGSRADALAAIEALSIHRYDPRLTTAVAEAAARDDALAACAAAAFAAR